MVATMKIDRTLEISDPSVSLSIAHKFSSDHGAQRDVGEV
jgi:hypothetical protein